MNWTDCETNTHQDGVIAHVIGATILGHFILDETAFLLLDIGFLWNIYLDAEMGLLPHPVAIGEFAQLRIADARPDIFHELRRNSVALPEL